MTGLRLVEISDDSYKIDKFLQSGDEFSISDPSEIENIFRSILEWSDGVKIAITLPDDHSYIGARISCDVDSKELEFFILEITDSNIEFKEYEMLSVTAELFNQSLKFNSKILEISDDRKLLVRIPDLIKKYAVRNGQRVYTNSSLIISIENELIKEIKIFELASGGMKCDSTGLRNGDVINGLLLSRKINFLVSRVCKKFAVLSPNTRADEHEFFEIYCEAKYPSLVNAKKVNEEDIVELYKKSGYFNKFKIPNESALRELEIRKSYSLKKECTSFYSCDYASLDKGSINGASSCSLAFLDSNVEYWAFHQMCSIKSPSLIELSGALYKWRAEYLSSMKKTEVKAIGWFDSRSRWLERIYVKFHLICPQSTLVNAKVFRINSITIDGSFTNVEGVKRQVGGGIRFFLSYSNFLGAVSPRFLNASNILDSVVCAKDSEDLNVLKNVLYTLKSTGHVSTIEVTVLEEKMIALLKDNFDCTHVDDVDRYFVINKNDLGLFCSSVDHAIAVTERKMKKYGKVY